MSALVEKRGRCASRLARIDRAERRVRKTADRIMQKALREGMELAEATELREQFVRQRKL